MKKEKKWVQPKLIVLTKGDGQEAVLTTCKVDFSGGDTGPSTNPFGCFSDAATPCSWLVST